MATLLWPDLSVLGVNPVVYLSPSQVAANLFIVAAGVAVVMLVRKPTIGRGVWATIVVLGGSGTKSALIPVLIGATVVGLIAAWRRRDQFRLVFASLLVGLLVVQAGIVLLASGTSGGKVVVLGTVRSLATYRDLVGDSTLRGVNDGLLLDSATSPRNFAYALLATAVFLTMHAVRVIGGIVLVARDGRRDPLLWWLFGAVLAGFSAALTIDHLGLSQIYFVQTAVPLGVVLTMAAYVEFTKGQSSREAIHFFLLSVVGGAFVTLALDYFIRARKRSGGYGALDRVLFPVLLLAASLVVVLVVWKKFSRRFALSGLGLAALIGVTVGMLVPAEVEFTSRNVYRWGASVSYRTLPRRRTI